MQAEGPAPELPTAPPVCPRESLPKKQAMKCLAALLLLGLVMGGCTTQSNSKNQQDSAPQQSVEQNLFVQGNLCQQFLRNFHL